LGNLQQVKFATAGVDQIRESWNIIFRTDVLFTHDPYPDSVCKLIWV